MTRERASVRKRFFTGRNGSGRGIPPEAALLIMVLDSGLLRRQQKITAEPFSLETETWEAL